MVIDMKKTMALGICTISLFGCGQLPVVSEGITNAQQNVLDARAQEDRQDSKDHAAVIKAIGEVAVNGDNTVKVVSLMMLDRIASDLNRVRAAKAQAPIPDGPITAFFKAAAPYIIPGAQIWASDRSGSRALKESFGNMNLISQIAGNIQRDPLVVNNVTPAPQIVQVPGQTQIVNPIIVDRPPPIILDQPILVPVPGG